MRFNFVKKDGVPGYLLNEGSLEILIKRAGDSIVLSATTATEEIIIPRRLFRNMVIDLLNDTLED